MPTSPEQQKNRAFYWTFIIGTLGLFVIARIEIVIRLIAVGVFALVLKMCFDSFYDAFRAWHAETLTEEKSEAHGERPRKTN
jgi:hypothetical protein